MLRVLHFYKTYYPDTFGGIEQVIYQLSKGGVEHGISTTVLALSDRGDFDNVQSGSQRVCYAKTTFALSSTPFSLSAIRKFKVLAAQADIIHYHFPYPFMDLLHFWCGIKKPTVVSYHSDIVKQKTALKLYSPLMERFLDSVNCIVAASPNYVNTSSTLQKYLHKVKVIPYGLDKLSYPDVNQQSLDYWREKTGDKFFLFIGAFRYYKGLHILLDAVRGTNLPLVIVGSGAGEEKLKQKAKTLSLNNVHFLGALPDEDKFALLQLCYSVVFPSHLRSEAFGIALLEGAMYGKSLISSEIGTGTTYINQDHVTGIVVPPSNPDALRAAMIKLYNDEKLTKKYGKNAFSRFQQLFTSECMINNYISTYMEVANAIKS